MLREECPPGLAGTPPKPLEKKQTNSEQTKNPPPTPFFSTSKLNKEELFLQYVSRYLSLRFALTPTTYFSSIPLLLAMFLPQTLKVDLFPKSEKPEWGFWEPLAVTAVHVQPRFTPLYIFNCEGLLLSRLITGRSLPKTLKSKSFDARNAPASSLPVIPF